jgi:pimeloyl-ACP methyl ester carboxylesterase
MTWSPAAADAAGLVRALGEANAIVVGHGLGGLVARTLAACYHKVVRQLAVISMAHPLRMRASVFTDLLGQGRHSGCAVGFQLPVWPERQLLRNDASRVGQVILEILRMRSCVQTRSRDPSRARASGRRPARQTSRVEELECLHVDDEPVVVFVDEIRSAAHGAAAPYRHRSRPRRRRPRCRSCCSEPASDPQILQRRLLAARSVPG